MQRARRSAGDAQLIRAGSITSCYAKVALADLPKVWSDAHYHQLFYEDEDEVGETLAFLKAEFSESVEGGGSVNNYGRLSRANGIYTATISIDDVDASRIDRLIEHENFVCGLARSNNGGS